MGVVRAALSEWFERGCKTDLVTLGAESLDLLEQGFPADAKRARAPRGRNEA
jgi:hypothetical protein